MLHRINLKNYEKFVEDKVAAQIAFLNKYDFTPYLREYHIIDDLIEAFCNDVKETAPIDLRLCDTVGYYSLDDFAHYLQERYPQFDIIQVQTYYIEECNT